MTQIGISEGTLPMLEMPCPEYFITHIGRVEEAGRDNVRLYCCTRKGKHLEPMYTVVIPITELAGMARLSMQIAADFHNQLMMMLTSTTVAH